MDESRSGQTMASSVSLEEFLGVASNSVLRAMQAQRNPNEPWPWGPIIFGIIFNPPESRGGSPVEVRTQTPKM
jgi:hypothetical protein